jgi:spore coat protein A
VHGGHSESASDGLPEAWFTPGFTLKGKDFVKGDIEPYHYNNDQEAATIWYHDHALGITRLNVYTGLAGFYLITDKTEMDLKAANKLPAAPYDLGLAIQDRMFTSDGELHYPAEPEEEEEVEAPSPTVLPEFFWGFYIGKWCCLACAGSRAKAISFSHAEWL